MTTEQRQLRTPGRYIGSLSEAVYSINDKGTPQFTLRFDLAQGGSAYVFKYLSDKALEYSAKDLGRLGFNGDFGAPQFSKGDGAELLLKHEDDQDGQPKERWDIGGGWMPDKASASEAQVMNSKWRAMYGSQPVRKPAAAASPAKGPPPSDESPFPPSDGPIVTKTMAWEEWEAQNGGKPDQARWKAEIKKIGKHESLFTSADWKVIFDRAIPI